MNRMMAPSAAPTKAPDLQGKSRRVRGSVSFGGNNGLVCLLADVRSTATTGAWPSPLVTAAATEIDPQVARDRRVHQQDHGPHSDPHETVGLQG
jgi:hypothetical protein